MPFGIGLPEIFVLLIVAVAIFGSKRVSEVAKDLGEASTEFSKAKKDLDKVIDKVGKEIETQITDSQEPSKTKKAKESKKAD